jgi:hypothetical protein
VDGKVKVRAPRYAPAEVAIPEGARQLVVELELGASASGRLLDRRGDPVAGADVSTAGSTARTDQRGEFILRDLPGGTHVIRARAGDEEAAVEVRLLSGEVRHDLDLRLGAGP